MSAQSEGGGGGDTKENTRLVAAIVQAQAVIEGRKAVKISDIDRSVREGKGREGRGRRRTKTCEKLGKRRKPNKPFSPHPTKIYIRHYPLLNHLGMGDMLHPQPAKDINSKTTQPKLSDSSSRQSEKWVVARVVLTLGM